MSAAVVVAKLIDTTTCIGCKACEVACQEWNDHGFALGPLTPAGAGYQTQPDLAHDFWNLIRFNELERDGGMRWLMAKYQCMHCADPGCLRACPAPGAIFVRENGTVDFASEHCIGCGYCITGCPFDVPRRHPGTKKVFKCTLCSDRTAVGLEPACVKACPTSCLTFGRRDDILDAAAARVEALRAEGAEHAGVYNPEGVGGTNVIYVLRDADRPEAYGLPRDPRVPWAVRLWQGPVKWLGSLLLAATACGAFLHYLRFGPKCRPSTVADDEP
jgi:formate dehydrogenase beta subunit